MNTLTMHPLSRLFEDNRQAPRRFEIVGKAAPEAEVMLYDVIGGPFGIDAGQFARDLKALKASTIHLRINSPGGEVSAARAMQTALAQHPARVIAHIDGLAASSATVVMLAADEIIASEGAFVMVHNPWSLTIGDADDHRKSAAVLDKFSESLATDYSRKSGQTLETVKAWMAAETWFTAAEAVEAGLVDRVEQVAAVKNEWSLGAFENVPAALIGKRETDERIQPIQEVLPMAHTDPAAAAGVLPLNNSEQAAEVRRLCLVHGLGAEFAERHIAAGTPLDTFRAAVLNELAAAGDAHNIRGASSAATVTRDSADMFREGAAEALYARVRGTVPSERARPFFGMSLVDLASEVLARRGGGINGMSPARRIENALHSTSDFPALLSNFANKSLLEHYAINAGAIKQVCRPSTVADFKQKYIMRRGEFPQLELVPENAEFKSGTTGEMSHGYALQTFGRIIGFSRQALVNDDLGAFDDTLQMAGAAAADLEARTLVNLLTSNSGFGPIMSDGAPLFDEAHSNVGGGAVDIAGLNAARARMRRQRGIDGVQVIDADPRFILVPVSRQASAEQLASTINPTTIAEANPFQGRIIPLAEPRLDDASTSVWYAVADPSRVPVIEYSYLNGFNGPALESRAGFEIDGVQFKVRLDFGCGAVDHRGAYRSTGV